MEKIILNVEGMSCEHCSSSIKNSLSELNGIKDIVVDLSSKTVTVEFENVSLEEIKETIEEQGYDVV